MYTLTWSLIPTFLSLALVSVRFKNTWDSLQLVSSSFSRVRIGGLPLPAAGAPPPRGRARRHAGAAPVPQPVPRAGRQDPRAGRSAQALLERPGVGGVGQGGVRVVACSAAHGRRPQVRGGAGEAGRFFSRVLRGRAPRLRGGGEETRGVVVSVGGVVGVVRCQWWFGGRWYWGWFVLRVVRGPVHWGGGGRPALAQAERRRRREARAKASQKGQSSQLVGW